MTTVSNPSTSAPAADLLDYVRSAAALLDLPLDAARAERVALHLGRTRALAALLNDLPLADELEPAELFRPAPFPPEDPA